MFISWGTVQHRMKYYDVHGNIEHGGGCRVKKVNLRRSLTSPRWVSHKCKDPTVLINKTTPQHRIYDVTFETAATRTCTLRYALRSREIYTEEPPEILSEPPPDAG